MIIFSIAYLDNGLCSSGEPQEIKVMSAVLTTSP